VWIVLSGWLQFLTTSHGLHPGRDRRMLQRGIYQSLALEEGYVAPAYRAAVRELRDRLHVPLEDLSHAAGTTQCYPAPPAAAGPRRLSPAGDHGVRGTAGGHCGSAAPRRCSHRALRPARAHQRMSGRPPAWMPRARAPAVPDPDAPADRCAG